MRNERPAPRTVQPDALFRAAADQAPQVMWIVNTKGAVTYLNRFWYELVGGEPPQWYGHEWAEATLPEDVEEMRARWREASAAGTVFAGMRRVRARDGTLHTLQYRASPVRDEHGQIACWVGMDADITEIKKAEHALRIANTELEAFSYSVSHDLRSPLATLQGLSRHLARRLGPSNDTQALHYLERIGVAALQMGDLIDGLLALAQVSRRSLQREPVDLAQMAHHIVDQLRKHEPSREVELVVADALTVHADRRMVRSLMDNLLGNAWKFSSQRERSRIEIGRDPGPGEPLFFVRDNGAGFDMAHAGQLFGTFQRLHDANEFPGTGIGLATVQRIVARHQGRVWAEAAPGVGATFFFSLGAEG